MGRISLFTPEGSEGHRFDVDDGSTVLVGRAPDPASSRVSALLAGGATTDHLAVASPSVSANHLLIESRPDRVVLIDLSSRNGTWVRLPALQRVDVPAPEELQLSVGDPPSSIDPDGDELPPVRWNDESDFAGALAMAVRGWLSRTLRAGEVEVVADSGSSALLAPGVVRIPLPAARALDVRLTATMDADWPQRIGQLFRQVDGLVRLYEAEQVARADGMILASDAIRAAYRQVVEAAARGTRLMILGPSGSGKELLARAYHRHSNRAGPFVAINCAELDDRIRAELFGTEAGAFTDAVKRAGAVEVADGGTLFLDEVGELSKEVQATLLRFLDRGEFARAGDLGRVRRSDVRIVCATNRDLREDVRQERFRLDLWFRLATHVVEVAPLHLRPDDLRAYLLARPHPGAPSTWEALSPQAVEVVRAYRWDSRWGGNFRELENFAARLPDAEGPGSLSAEACRAAIDAGAIGGPSPVARAPSLTGVGWPTTAEGAAKMAAHSYLEDHGEPPSDWNAVKDYIENHLKPVLFAHLSGVSEAPSLESARAEASRLGADRATRLKQLERYFERFGASRDKR